MFGYFDEAQKIIDSDKFGHEVWMSGSKFAQNQGLVGKEKFVLVIACMDTQFRYGNSNCNVQHLRFPIQDNQQCDIKGYFLPTFQVIQSARKTGKVLIYSKLGISRSSAILISYIMQKYNKKFKQALEEVRLKRPCAQPCQNYVKQLQWFQKFHLNRI